MSAVLNARRSHPKRRPARWSVEMLRRATRRFVQDGLAEPNLLRQRTKYAMKRCSRWSRDRRTNPILRWHKSARS